MKPNLENPPKGLQSADSFDDLFTITCGRCKATSPLLKWVSAQSNSVYKCPGCGYRFKRKPKDTWDGLGPFYELVEIK